jgi:hypothetical protein
MLVKWFIDLEDDEVVTSVSVVSTWQELLALSDEVDRFEYLTFDDFSILKDIL